MKNLLLLVTALLTFTCAQAINAAEVAGRVIMAKGQVTAINSEGSSRSISRRDKVFASDIIKTGANSQAQIRFIDKALLALKANSEINIKAYHFPDTEKQQDGQVLMKLVKGGFRTLSGSIGKGSKSAYKVETPVASIGIRGTHYEIELVEQDMFLAVWDGTIDVYPQQSPQDSVGFGLGEDFSFGKVPVDGKVIGLLTPPSELNSSEQSSDDSNEEGNDNSAAPTTTNNNETAISLNPQDTAPENSTLNANTCKNNPELCQKACDADPDMCKAGTTPKPKSDDLRLTDQEWQLATNNTSTKRSYVSYGDSSYGAMKFTNATNNETFFIVLPNETVNSGGTDFLFPVYTSPNKFGLKIVIKPGELPESAMTTYASPVINGQTIDNITWGEWNGKNGSSGWDAYHTINNLAKEEIKENLRWIEINPLDSTELASLAAQGQGSDVQLNFNLSSSSSSFKMETTLGDKVGDISGTINMNLTSGDVSSNTLSIDLLSSGGESLYTVSAIGDKGLIKGSEFSLQFKNGTVTTSGGDAQYACTAGCVTGNMSGLLFNPKDGQAITPDQIGIAGFLSLIAQYSNSEETINGVFVSVNNQAP